MGQVSYCRTKCAHAHTQRQCPKYNRAWNIKYDMIYNLSKQKQLFNQFCENIISNIIVQDGKSINKDKQCAPSCGWIFH